MESDIPEFKSNAFVCPICETYAHQEWGEARTTIGGRALVISEGDFSRCARCSRYSYWAGGNLGYPSRGKSGPHRHPEMPEGPAADYDEAQTILDLSPRGSCALLRLALQKLFKELGKPGNNLNDDIATLVRDGLSVEVQQALDALRVVGNNAVHPGEFDVTDDRETAVALFECMNVIVEQRIAQPKRIAELYGRLPESALQAISRRDEPETAG